MALPQVYIEKEVINKVYINISTSKSSSSSSKYFHQLPIQTIEIPPLGTGFSALQESS